MSRFRELEVLNRRDTPREIPGGRRIPGVAGEVGWQPRSERQEARREARQEWREERLDDRQEANRDARRDLRRRKRIERIEDRQENKNERRDKRQERMNERMDKRQERIRDRIQRVDGDDPIVSGWGPTQRLHGRAGRPLVRFQVESDHLAIVKPLNPGQWLITLAPESWRNQRRVATPAGEIGVAPLMPMAIHAAGRAIQRLGGPPMVICNPGAAGAGAAGGGAGVAAADWRTGLPPVQAQAHAPHPAPQRPLLPALRPGAHHRPAPLLVRPEPGAGVIVRVMPDGRRQQMFVPPKRAGQEAGLALRLNVNAPAPEAAGFMSAGLAGEIGCNGSKKCAACNRGRCGHRGGR